jgi:hypothetical protein
VRPGAEELTAVLEPALARRRNGTACIAALERRPSQFQTSFPLEELDLRLEDGSTLALIFKDLSPDRLPEKARAAKPPFLLDPRREPEVYERILEGSGLGAPACYATVCDEGRSRYWLFIERVDATPLWQIGELELWRAAAAWLAGLHERFSPADTVPAAHLLRYDADAFRLWRRRALELAPGRGLGRGGRERIAWLADRYEPVVERLASLPATFMHGEFYASNVLVANANAATRVCPIDWELAAVGPGLLDVAALSTGKWGDAERASIALAYADALSAPPASREEFLESVDYCRLHIAVQWLGWAEGWRPPRAHRYDWLSEATRLAEELGL